MIDKFEGKYAFLSNFYESPIEQDRIIYPTVEHYFQAQKTLDFEERLMIARAGTPGQAKRMGRSVTLRKDWEDVKLEVMEFAVREKFTTHAELRKQLIATGDEELVEGNWWKDRFWGVCEGTGQNHLGQILMKVRDELK